MSELKLSRNAVCYELINTEKEGGNIKFHVIKFPTDGNISWAWIEVVQEQIEPINGWTILLDPEPTYKTSKIRIKEEILQENDIEVVNSKELSFKAAFDSHKYEITSWLTSESGDFIEQEVAELFVKTLQELGRIGIEFMDNGIQLSKDREFFISVKG